MNLIEIKPGERGTKTMPHSEVCMSMRVAGNEMEFELLDQKYPSVQLYKDGQPFSGTITTGEAGIYTENETFYYYK